MLGWWYLLQCMREEWCEVFRDLIWFDCGYALSERGFSIITFLGFFHM